MAKGNFKDIFSRKAVTLNLRDLDENAPEGQTVIGQFENEQFPNYGIYSGGDNQEFICEILDINPRFNILTDEEIRQLKQGEVNASQFPMDAFIPVRIDRFDFNKDEWVEAPEHLGSTMHNDYYFYDDDSEFLSEFTDFREKFQEQKNTPPQQEITHE